MNVKAPQISMLKLFLLMISSYILLGANTAMADIGSVSVSSVTDSSMNVTWTAPSGNYQLSGSTPHYKICYKEAGQWVNACSGGTVVYSNTTNITLTGLDPVTEYKIKVYCHCEKKNIFGNWKNPKWRKIGVNYSTTSPVAIPNTFLITDSSPTSLDVQATHIDMPDFDAVRICYKKKWTLVTNFVPTCGSLIPEAYWGTNTASLGYFDVAAINPVNTVVAPNVNLADCTRYRVTGLGVNGAFMQLIYNQIGTTLGSTSGKCGFWNMFKMVVTDHDHDVLPAYAKYVDGFYKGGLFSHLAESYNKELYRAQSILLADNEDLKNTQTLLTYLVETDAEEFNQWQQDLASQRGPMSMEQYIEKEFPKTYYMLKDELNVK